MEYRSLRLERQGSIARLTLTRPEAANTITPAVAKELRHVAQHLADDPEVRAVLLCAEGRIFSAGGDLGGFASEGDNLGKAMAAMIEDFHAAIETFAMMDAPVIAGVDGVAAGAGFSLVLMASFVLASEKARFTMAYTGAGLSPDGSSTYFLPRLVGLRRAEELMLTNRQLSADEAAEWGIVNRVVPAGNLMAEAEALAERLAAGPTKACGAVRRLLMASFDSTLADQLAREGDSIVAMTATDDGREGISAFLEKREPVFTGR